MQAAETNNVARELAKVGRPLAKGEEPQAGEAVVSLSDEGKIVQPDDADATQRLAVPKRYADAYASSVARRAPTPARGPFGKAYHALTHGITMAETHSSPAIVPVHGRNITLAVGEEPSTSTLANIAGVPPLSDYAVGAGRMAGVDFTDPETIQNTFDLSRRGGMRTPVTGKYDPARLLFGAQGMDPRGRLAVASAYKATHPNATPLEIAQHVTETLGSYVHANQPEGVRMAQGSGLTSFAPAAVAFTRGAVRRTVPVFAGQGGLGRRLALMARTVGAPVATVEATNELLSHHSTLSNKQGHRLDVDVGKTGPEGGEEYVPFSGVAPLLSRAMNITGLRPLVEGETDPREYVRAPVNALLAHLGIGPRVAAAAMANAEPYMTRAGVPASASPVQFSGGRQLAGQAERAAGAFLGAPAAIMGATSFTENATPLEKVADIFGIPVPHEDFRTAPGYHAMPTAYKDKESAAITKVYNADAKDRPAIITQELDAARAAQLPPQELRKFRASLYRARARAKP